LFVNGEPHTHVKVDSTDDFLRVDDGRRGVDDRSDIGFIFKDELLEGNFNRT
jgi:hypothetical protein